MLVSVGGVSGGYKTGGFDERSVVVRTPREQQCSWDVNSMSDMSEAVEKDRVIARIVMLRLRE